MNKFFAFRYWLKDSYNLKGTLSIREFWSFCIVQACTIVLFAFILNFLFRLANINLFYLMSMNFGGFIFYDLLFVIVFFLTCSVPLYTAMAKRLKDCNKSVLFIFLPYLTIFLSDLIFNQFLNIRIILSHSLFEFISLLTAPITSLPVILGIFSYIYLGYLLSLPKKSDGEINNDAPDNSKTTLATLDKNSDQNAKN